MSDTLLSKSLVENQESSTMRDPFQIARNKFEAKSEVLSFSPVQSSSEPMFNAPSADEVVSYDSSGIPEMLKKAGVDGRGLALNDVGRLQLISRLKRTFGESFQQNSSALDILNAFNEKLGKAGKTDMTASISGAERTLKAILGG